MEDFQTRYAHLLQPIKDLTRNWDVDVAAELEDYLALVSARRRAGEGGGLEIDISAGSRIVT